MRWLSALAAASLTLSCSLLNLEDDFRIRNCTEQPPDYCDSLNAERPSDDPCLRWSCSASSGFCELLPTDVDRDSYIAPGCTTSGQLADCDDSQASVYPDAPELCDGLDNDCDDAIDEGLYRTAAPVAYNLPNGHVATDVRFTSDPDPESTGFAAAYSYDDGGTPRLGLAYFETMQSADPFIGTPELHSTLCTAEADGTLDRPDPRQASIASIGIGARGGRFALAISRSDPTAPIEPGETLTAGLLNPVTTDPILDGYFDCRLYSAGFRCATSAREPALDLLEQRALVVFAHTQSKAATSACPAIAAHTLGFAAADAMSRDGKEVLRFPGGDTLIADMISPRFFQGQNGALKRMPGAGPAAVLAVAGLGWLVAFAAQEEVTGQGGSVRIYHVSTDLEVTAAPLFTNTEPMAAEVQLSPGKITPNGQQLALAYRRGGPTDGVSVMRLLSLDVQAKTLTELALLETQPTPAASETAPTLAWHPNLNIWLMTWLADGAQIRTRRYSDQGLPLDATPNAAFSGNMINRGAYIKTTPSGYTLATIDDTGTVLLLSDYACQEN